VFNVGDKVKVTSEVDEFYGQTGVVIEKLDLTYPFTVFFGLLDGLGIYKEDELTHP
jgi:hypothetical protein